MPPVPAYFTTYLLLPLVAIVLGSITIIINKKNALMSNKRLIITVLAGSFILSITGFLGLIDLWYVPFFYALVQVLSLLEGIFFARLILADLGPLFPRKPLFVTLVTLTITALGASLFSIFFNYFSTLSYGLWAATSVIPFLIPVLFVYTYAALLAVPNEIYKLWYYPVVTEEISLEDVDYYRLMLLNVQLHKERGRNCPPIKVTARTTPDMLFCEWFQKFIDDYNHRFPNDIIHTHDENGQQYGWLFYYLKPTIFRLRHYIDYDLTIRQNKLREKYLIIAKRVKENK